MGSRPIVVVYPFVGDKFGGSDISAIKLIEALQPSEVRPVVVVHKPNGDFVKYLDKRQIDYLTVKVSVLRPRYRGAGSAAAAGYLYTVARLIRFLRRHKADIVHTNDGSIHATWGLPTVLSGARLLWHHRGDPAGRGDKPSRAVYCQSYRYCLQLCKADLTFAPHQRPNLGDP